MNIVVLGILFIVAFILQYIFSHAQIKSFNKSYTYMRSLGRVVIGRKKGAARAGAIVLLAIDKDNKVIEGKAMQGITVVARFREFNYFNGLDVATITEKDCKALRLSKSLTMATLDGVYNFKTIIAGGEVQAPDSLFGKISKKLRVSKA